MSRSLLITTDRNPQRRRDSVRQLHDHGVEFEIVEGIDGQTNLGLEFCGTWRMKVNEVACYYSHLRCFKRLIDYGWSHAVIFEDDFLFEAGRSLNDLVFPSSADHVMLHGIKIVNSPRKELHTDGRLNRVKPCGLCLPGYVISRRLALYMVDKHRICSKPIDNLLCDVADKQGFEFYDLVNPIVGVRPIASSIHALNPATA